MRGRSSVSTFLCTNSMVCFRGSFISPCHFIIPKGKVEDNGTVAVNYFPRFGKMQRCQRNLHRFVNLDALQMY